MERRRQLPDERSFELATATAMRRMVASAVLIGLVTILGTCGVVYFGYGAHRQGVLHRYERESLSLARTIADHVERDLADHEMTAELRSAAYRRVAWLWERTEDLPEGAALVVVEASGKVALETALPGLRGRDVGDVTLAVEGRDGPETLAEVLAERRDWSGRTGPFPEKPHIVGGAWVEPLEALVAVCVPEGVILHRIRTFALPWGLGAAGIAGLLVPLALALLYRSYHMAQQMALATASSLRRSEARYRGIYHNAPIMMHSIDQEGRLVRVNDHWLKTLGYERQEVLGRPAVEFLTAESRRRAVEKVLPRFFRKGVVHDVPYQMVTRDGRVLDVLLSATAERDDEGAIVRSQAILVDVTAQQRAETEREAMIRMLEAKNSELERFTYTVSHDLKSPLVTIKGFLGHMVEDLEAGRAERALADARRVGEAADRMRELLDDLLELSRIGRIVHPPEDVHLVELAREAVQQVAGAVARRGVEVEISPDLPWVRCDRVRMLQVLQNLIENAVKFMGDQAEPRVVIGCRPDGEGIVCFVSDNGIGLDAEDRETVFELFTKGDSRQEGTGIGLALVRRIIEVHGGRVWVESDGAGAGAAFCFTLPVATRPEESGILNLDALADGDGT